MFTLPCELDSGLTGFSTDSSLVHEKESAHISSSKLPLSSSPEALWPSTAARISAGASRELRESSSSELSFALVSDTGLRDFPLWRGFFLLLRQVSSSQTPPLRLAPLSPQQQEEPIIKIGGCQRLSSLDALPGEVQHSGRPLRSPHILRQNRGWGYSSSLHQNLLECLPVRRNAAAAAGLHSRTNGKCTPKQRGRRRTWLLTLIVA